VLRAVDSTWWDVECEENDVLEPCALTIHMSLHCLRREGLFSRRRNVQGLLLLTLHGAPACAGEEIPPCHTFVA
jgi:hypothetical protein